nr:hypothetical protein L203_05809 [Cryptococcus depauperatus CBS 7841]
MDILARISDGEPKSSHPAPHRPTKWEDHFLKEANSRRPHRKAMNTSNVGLTLAVTVIGRAAFCTTVMGHEKGLRLGIIWVDEAAMIEEDVDYVEHQFMITVRRLIGGKIKAKELIVQDQPDIWVVKGIVYN